VSDQGPARKPANVTVTRVARIDFGAREEREHDGGEGGEEVKPLVRAELDDVAEKGSQGRARRARPSGELGRNDARNEDRGGEECCKLDGLHDDLLKRRLTNGVEAISAGARLWREPHRSARRVAVRFSGSSPRLSSDVR
jgi:hypothetical protein